MALTAHDDNLHHNQVEWVGMNYYLVKPLTLEKCKAVLKRFVKAYNKCSFYYFHKKPHILDYTLKMIV